MDEFDVIETPENVDLQRRLAGIGSRFAAGLLDSLLLAAAGILLFLLLALFVFGARASSLVATWDDWASTVALTVLILFLFMVYWGYFVFFELWRNGQTPGKKYMKIRVVQEEGGAVTFSAIAIRNLLRAVDLLGFYGVAGITMFVTRKVQRLGDLAAGTVVISEEIPDYAAKADKKQRVFDDLAATAVALENTQLKPQEYRLLHNYWLRRDQLSREARERLLPALLRPILERLGTPFPGDSLAALERQVEDLMRRARAAEPGRQQPERPREEKT
jgi:uncharacterized RDD family membrane protein YckC